MIPSAMKFSIILKHGTILFLCLLASACLTTDVEIAGNHRPGLQTVLSAAGKIRKLSNTSETQQDRKHQDKLANEYFKNGLAGWRTISPQTVLYERDFDTNMLKLFDAYSSYLIETKQPSLAIDTLRLAIIEARNARSYQSVLVFRLQLADLLASIGQIEAAKNILEEAQAFSDKIYGQLTVNTQNPHISHLVVNASIITASIRNGINIDKNRLLTFCSIYEKAVDSNPSLKLATPLSNLNIDKSMNSNEEQYYYRHDQEYFRWLAIGAYRAGDRTLAKHLTERMLKAADTAKINRFTEHHNLYEDFYWKGNYELQARQYMSMFYINPNWLKHEKSKDTIYGFETKFDSLLAASDIYILLDELSLADSLLINAKDELTVINAFSTELQKHGHLGLRVEQRNGELKRITAKLHIKHKRWKEALALLDEYITWSEVYRNSLSLEERLPYFRGQSQAVYQDAIFARASLFAAEPTDANFILALDALGKLKSRHLLDSLEAGGKSKFAQGASTGNNLKSIVKGTNGFLSIADAGENLIIFFADQNENKIRTIRKPNDFDKSILVLRNDLAERQDFDSQNIRKISSLVLGEFETSIFGKPRLMVEIDGALSFLPVELWLNAKMQPLGESASVSYIPTLGMADLKRNASNAKGMLAFGDPQFNQQLQVNAIGAGSELALRGKRGASGFAPLPETRDEINSIIQNVREGGKAVLGSDATKSEFFRQARTPYKYMHFATHGVVGGEIPRLNEPALVLTPENNDPGFLTATEIGKMDIPADLVVLSACNSGNGEYFNGEGLMGLGRSFILAGSKAVVVSLWPVDSNTTKELMVIFYRELEATGDASLALSKARNAIMTSDNNSGVLRSIKRQSNQSTASDFNGKKNPFFWAPFILIEAGI